MGKTNNNKNNPDNPSKNKRQKTGGIVQVERRESSIDNRISCSDGEYLSKNQTNPKLFSSKNQEDVLTKLFDKKDLDETIEKYAEQFLEAGVPRANIDSMQTSSPQKLRSSPRLSHDQDTPSCLERLVHYGTPDWPSSSKKAKQNIQWETIEADVNLWKHATNGSKYAGRPLPVDKRHFSCCCGIRSHVTYNEAYASQKTHKRAIGVNFVGDKADFHGRCLVPGMRDAIQSGLASKANQKKCDYKSEYNSFHSFNQDPWYSSMDDVENLCQCGSVACLTEKLIYIHYQWVCKHQAATVKAVKAIGVNTRRRCMCCKTVRDVKEFAPLAYDNLRKEQSQKQDMPFCFKYGIEKERLPFWFTCDACEQKKSLHCQSCKAFRSSKLRELRGVFNNIAQKMGDLKAREALAGQVCTGMEKLVSKEGGPQKNQRKYQKQKLVLIPENDRSKGVSSAKQLKQRDGSMQSFKQVQEFMVCPIIRTNQDADVDTSARKCRQGISYNKASLQVAIQICSKNKELQRVLTYDEPSDDGSSDGGCKLGFVGSEFNGIIPKNVSKEFPN